MKTRYEFKRNHHPTYWTISKAIIIIQEVEFNLVFFGYEATVFVHVYCHLLVSSPGMANIKLIVKSIEEFHVSHTCIKRQNSPRV